MRISSFPNLYIFWPYTTYFWANFIRLFATNCRLPSLLSWTALVLFLDCRSGPTLQIVQDSCLFLCILTRFFGCFFQSRSGPTLQIVEDSLLFLCILTRFFGCFFAFLAFLQVQDSYKLLGFGLWFLRRSCQISCQSSCKALSKIKQDWTRSCQRLRKIRTKETWKISNNFPQESCKVFGAPRLVR
jgi:hypothetical protein